MAKRAEVLLRSQYHENEKVEKANDEEGMYLKKAW